MAFIIYSYYVIIWVTNICIRWFIKIQAPYFWCISLLVYCYSILIYKRKLSEEETMQLIFRIKTLNLDTLKKEYINPYILDGLYTTEIYFGTSIGTNQNKIEVQNMNLPILDSLCCYIDDLILDKEFSFSSWGQE